MTQASTHVDVLIVGAGLSGIGAAVHVKTRCPGYSFALLEGRDAIGGTWDLFRYPGIRSDSDMYTLGYRFKPWTHAKSIADGDSILCYLHETVQEYGLQSHIRTGHRVLSADWSSDHALWTLSVHTAAEETAVTMTCKFFWVCSGYYRYDQGYTPEFPGSADFLGQMVHPQHWPANLDYAGKRVVVIGSGATAITLVPTMADKAAHVTMLQRSPSYVASLPSQDKIANTLRRWLPLQWAYLLTRWKNVLLGMAFYNGARRFPNAFSRFIRAGVNAALQSRELVKAHFTPSYKPWDQRLCMVPDGDLFRVIRSGRAEVVTDQIDTFTRTGIRLQSGREIAADIVVTATGLDLLVMGGIALHVDGKPVVMGEHITYKGMMLNDIPNMAFVIGYTNASWTLKADLVSEYVCRLLQHMQQSGQRQCTPRFNDPRITTQHWIDFTSGYIQRALHKFPMQGNKTPWCLHQNYARDVYNLRYGSLRDGAMEFSNHTP
jgi:cation diffusion facilitator CzcD-associated flavoprotein CzcO